jgi:hypothetical protein
MIAAITRARNRKRTKPNKERPMIEDRERRNIHRYGTVTKLLKEYIVTIGLGDNLTKKLLNQLAHIVSVSAIPNIRIDRMAQRVKSAMICWFCEHFDAAESILWGSISSVFQIAAWDFEGNDDEWDIDEDQV